MVSATLLAGLLAVSGSSDVTLLEFTADWCGACQAVKPTVQRLTAAGYPVRVVNVDRERELVAQFRVTAVPCFVMISGGREVDRVAEAASYGRLVQMFERAGRPQQMETPAATVQPVSDQGGQRSAGIGLPRPLASLARNLGQRREPEQSLVQIDSGTPAAQSSQPPIAPINVASNVPSAQPRATETPNAVAPPAQSTAPGGQQAAIRSTVRLRVDDLSGHSVATGTIIDTHQNEALIVTCGHVFRASSGKGRIAVDLFVDNQPRTVNGTLISYDLERDLGFVAIPADSILTSARIAPTGFRMERGQAVFSVGCDRGGDPSVRTSRITGIDRYVGAPNIEVAGQPVEGRSGGGLFSSDGELIGVCNAADPSDNEGVFASLPAIHWELDRIGQRRIYAGADTQLAQASPARPESSPGELRPVTQTALSADPPRPAVSIQPAFATKSSDDTEVICIVRSRANPQGTEQLLILDRPSRDLLDRLANESRNRPEMAQQPPARVAIPRAIMPDNGGQIIRAQSDR